MSKFKLLIKGYALLGIVGLLSSCGGGNSPSQSATDPNIIFWLYVGGYLNSTYQEEYLLTGTTTPAGQASTNVTGSLIRQPQSQTTFNGNPAVPVLETYALTPPGFTIQQTEYFSVDVNDLTLLGLLTYGGAMTGPPLSTSVLPATALIGNSGQIGDYFDSAGNTYEYDWRLADAGNGRAYLTISSQISDTSGVWATNEDVYLIDPDGQRVSFARTSFRVGFGDPTTIVSGDNTKYMRKWYLDDDGDGYGDPAISVIMSTTGYVGNNSDCDDSNSSTYPGAEEVDDNVDNNCNGTIDEGFPKIIFVTSTPHQGNQIGGLAAADAICQNLAEGSSSLAPAGTYVAWLSSSTEDARDRVTDDQNHAEEYQLVDGTTIANGFPDLVDFIIENPINMDEAGGAVNAVVWTGSGGTGIHNGAQQCGGNWSSSGTGTKGGTGFTSNQWTWNGEDDCISQNRLYCFQK